MKNNKNYVFIGIFGQPHGLKGEIKINIKTSSLESFKMLKSYFIEEDKSALMLKDFKKIGNKIVASIEKCHDRDAALLYKGKHIFSLRKNFPKNKDNEYYIVDLIGLSVIDLKNNTLGIVENIKNFGAGDLIEINNPNKKNFYIPMNKENLISVEIDKKVIIVDPIEGLVE